MGFTSICHKLPWINPTNTLIDILGYLLQADKHEVSVTELRKEFGANYEKVYKFLEDYPFLNVQYEEVLDEESPPQTIESYRVKNHRLLLTELQRLNDRCETREYHTFNILLTALLVLFAAYALVAGFLQYAAQVQANEINKLDSQASLSISRFTLQMEKNNESTRVKSNLCILNRGTVDTGEITVQILNKVIAPTSFALPELKGKGYTCVNRTLDLLGFAVKKLDVTIKLDCLNCQNSPVSIRQSVNLTD